MILHKTKFEIILIHCQIPHFFGGGTIFWTQGFMFARQAGALPF
jgi:hypothetical protein